MAKLNLIDFGGLVWMSEDQGIGIHDPSLEEVYKLREKGSALVRLVVARDPKGHKVFLKQNKNTVVAYGATVLEALSTLEVACGDVANEANRILLFLKESIDIKVVQFAAREDMLLKQRAETSEVKDPEVTAHMRPMEEDSDNE